MKLLANKDIRRLFIGLMAVLALLPVSGLIFARLAANDFADRMFARDCMTAGYLLEHDVKPSVAAGALAGTGGGREQASGRELLSALGYGENSLSLLPDANPLLLKYQLILVVISVLIGTLVLTAFFMYFRRQQRAIGRAEACIRTFMDGYGQARLDSEEEGSLSALFASVNNLTTSLKAHIDSEKQTKDFLKETISNISHQLKTPLSAMKINIEIIREESSDEAAVRMFCDRTEGALEHMEILIRNLLRIAKLDAGAIIFNKRKQNISALMHEIASGFEIRAEREGKLLKLDGAEDVELYCDGDWIAEAVGNLVKNAIDHTGKGDCITVEWKDTPAIVKIIVRDTGKGIHPEDIHHIFKRFYRSRFSQDTQGAGLGLSLAKSIIEAHNGTITVESAPGKGSVFTLDFLKLTEL